MQLAALEKYRLLISAEEFLALQAELEKPLVGALRVNPQKANPDEMIPAWADRYGWSLRAVPYCPTGWWLDKTELPPSQTPEHRMGFYYLQDAASMLPVELFDFEPGEMPLVLDMAASPGGKTTHLLDRMADQGLVMANDSSASRIQALRVVLANWGAVSGAVTNFPGEKFGAWYPETFDRVLLDAPCSMENLRSTESHPMRPITNRERMALADRQVRLLVSALQAVKVGGQVVYSTCTLAPEEDEGVLDAVLTRYGRAVQLDDMNERLRASAPGLRQVGELAYHPDVVRAARLFPHRLGTSGFFAARLTKTDSIPGEQEQIPARSLTRAGWQPVPDVVVREQAESLLQKYGLDIAGKVSGGNLVFWQNGDSVILAPAMYFNRFGEFPVQMLGLLFAEQTPSGWEITHQAAARYWREIQSGKILLDFDQVNAWQRGENLSLRISILPAGQVAMLTDSWGRYLGRGRITSRGVKNLLPRRVIY